MSVHPAKTQLVAKDPRFLHAHSEDSAVAQTKLSLRYAHTHFVGFVMSWLICHVGALLTVIQWEHLKMLFLL